ncbi:MAG TPA: hypothetical protein VNQ79_24650 [Blastocatellia bacterium]|nr:hypothetical protein [Blastocatellia bacterium]
MSESLRIVAQGSLYGSAERGYAVDRRRGFNGLFGDVGFGATAYPFLFFSLPSIHLNPSLPSRFKLPKVSLTDIFDCAAGTDRSRHE